MPLIYQYRIYANDLLNNPKLLYVFGDNVQRVGHGGQAKEMRGHSNAVGVATKWAPSLYNSAFFSDDRFDEQVEIIKTDMKPIIEGLHDGKIVVWPLEGIGTGFSELPERAPKTWEFLRLAQAALEKM